MLVGHEIYVLHELYIKRFQALIQFDLKFLRKIKRLDFNSIKQYANNCRKLRIDINLFLSGCLLNI